MRNHIEDSSSQNAVFLSGNTIYFYADINAETVCRVAHFIDILESQKEKNITIILNSAGGEEYSGLAFYDRIRASKCKFTIIGTGFVGSMALIVYVAGDRRIATKNTRFLNHQGSTEINGRASDIKIASKEMDELEEICNRLIAERTKQDIKKLRESIKAGDKYMNVDEAIKTGIVHEIIDEIKKR